MPKPKSLVDESLDMQEEYEAKYGRDTVVLTAVGSFMECYQVKSAEENIGCAERVASLTNIILTRKNKSIHQVSRTNPLMAGFPSASLQRYLAVLVNHGYTVVVCDQITPPPNPKRAVTGIYSPGTFSEDALSNPDANNIVCLVVRQEALLGNLGQVFLIGMSSTDLSTGHTATHEAVSTAADPEFAIEDAVRFIHTYAPRETLLLNETRLCDDTLTNMLDVASRHTVFLRDVDPCSRRVDFQEQLLKRIYPDTGMLTAVEFLDLERRPLATLSFTLLLNFCHEHGGDIVTKLLRPEDFDPCSHLVLEHNAIAQLNVMPTGSHQKYGSLYDCYSCFTSTAMGRRMLKSVLLKPLTDAKAIDARLDLVEHLTHNYESVEECLRGMPDIERLARKACLQKVQPSELASLMDAFGNVGRLLETVERSATPFSDVLPGRSVLAPFQSLVASLHHTFDALVLEKHVALTSVDSNLFRRGILPDADTEEDTIKRCRENMRALREQLNDRVGAGATGVKLEQVDKDGHFLSLTTRRAATLKGHLASVSEVAGIDPSTFVYTANGTTSRLTCAALDTWSRDSSRAVDRLRAVCCETFTQTVKDLFDVCGPSMWEVIRFVSTADFLKASAKAAVAYKYCRPRLLEKECASVKATGVRHPIVERLLTGCEYVPFWMDLGNGSMDIMLLYGANACGKSTSSKAIGLCVVLAQCGMYVPCATMEIAPFHRVMTRIEGRDNIFAGQSSFAIEMGELRGILQRADKYSLVLGDELCKGTETTSGTAIVAAALTWLARAGAKGVFATHLHQLASMERIKKLDRVKDYHLEVHCDKRTGELVYDRSLHPGSGDATYGLEVAQALKLDPKFMDIAHEIRRELEGDTGIVSVTQSRYNPSVFMKRCQVCDSPGKEVHHVKQQKDADEHGFIGHTHKNHASNLMVLCDRCHDLVHHPDPETGKQLVVSELKMTSSGPKREMLVVEGVPVGTLKKPRPRRLARPE